MTRTIRNIFNKVYAFVFRRNKTTSVEKPVCRVDAALWKETAQDGELKFHLNDTWRPSGGLMDQTIKLFDYFGFTQNDFVGKTVIDIGAGSKLRTKYFRGANIIAVEPLADRFIASIEWCDLKDAHKVFSRPAEARIEECVGLADLVISINVLDHCYDFELIIGNIASYLKDGAFAFVSFDEHGAADALHPLILNPQLCEKIFARNGLFVEKYTKGAGDILRTYGHGEYCLNFWLRRKF